MVTTIKLTTFLLMLSEKVSQGERNKIIEVENCTTLIYPNVDAKNIKGIVIIGIKEKYTQKFFKLSPFKIVDLYLKTKREAKTDKEILGNAPLALTVSSFK